MFNLQSLVAMASQAMLKKLISSDSRDCKCHCTE